MLNLGCISNWTIYSYFLNVGTKHIENFDKPLIS